MSDNKSLTNFWSKLSQDKKLMKEFFSYPDIDDMYEYAKSHSSGDFSKEELQQALTLTLSYMDNKVSDKDLETVAGGSADVESDFRTVALLAGPIVTLIISGAQTIMQWRDSGRRVMKDNENTRLNELLRKKQELQTQLEIRDLEHSLNKS